MLNLAQTLLHNAKKGKVCRLLKWCIIQTLDNKLGTLNTWIWIFLEILNQNSHFVHFLWRFVLIHQHFGCLPKWLQIINQQATISIFFQIDLKLLIIKSKWIFTCNTLLHAHKRTKQHNLLFTTQPAFEFLSCLFIKQFLNFGGHELATYSKFQQLET